MTNATTPQRTTERYLLHILMRTDDDTVVTGAEIPYRDVLVMMGDAASFATMTLNDVLAAHPEASIEDCEDCDHDDAGARITRCTVCQDWERQIYPRRIYGFTIEALAGDDTAEPLWSMNLPGAGGSARP